MENTERPSLYLFLSLFLSLCTQTLLQFTVGSVPYHSWFFNLSFKGPPQEVLWEMWTGSMLCFFFSVSSHLFHLCLLCLLVCRLHEVRTVSKCSHFPPSHPAQQLVYNESAMNNILPILKH